MDMDFKYIHIIRSSKEYIYIGQWLPQNICCAD